MMTYNNRHQPHHHNPHLGDYNTETPSPSSTPHGVDYNLSANQNRCEYNSIPNNRPTINYNSTTNYCSDDSNLSNLSNQHQYDYNTFHHNQSDYNSNSYRQRDYDSAYCHSGDYGDLTNLHSGDCSSSYLTNPCTGDDKSKSFSNGDYNKNRHADYGSPNLEVQYTANRRRNHRTNKTEDYPDKEYPFKRDSPIGGESCYRGETTHSISLPQNCSNTTHNNHLEHNPPQPELNLNCDNCLIRSADQCENNESDNRPLRCAAQYEEKENDNRYIRSDTQYEDKQIKLGEINPMSPLCSGLGDPTSPAYAGLFGKIEIHKRPPPEPSPMMVRSQMPHRPKPSGTLQRDRSKPVPSHKESTQYNNSQNHTCKSKYIYLLPYYIK